MATPPFVSAVPPPLPSGWSEHIGPGGQVYYYNAQSRESTYIRPIPRLPIIPQALPAKKEKPQIKTPIPGTDWIRVTTTQGNIFYSHKVKKESVWTVPVEIKDAVETLEQDAEKDGIAKGVEGMESLQLQQMMEVERIKGEVQELVKRKAEDVLVEEVVIRKKTKVEEEDEDEDGNEDEDSDEDEEDWRREAAAQLAAEAEAERQRVDEAERVKKEVEEEAKKAQSLQINMPERVDLSLEEGKALFKTLLREKDINPLYPWDTCLPLFVSDPRYVLLPSVSARREAFDEYCRDRAREIRQSVVKKEREAANPSEEYERLLKEEVRSTRTSWSDFRRNWKKDRRFYSWGRDDREREKKFREYIKDLGEKKRAAVQKAEVDFFTLLRERGEDIKEGSVWKDVKRKLYDDPRYDAVGSSSLREELFDTFLKGSGSTLPKSAQSMKVKAPDQESEEMGETEETERHLQVQRKERKERAMKGREERIKTEKGRLEADIGRSRRGINREEGEREFRSLLTDAIRDPQVTWDAILPQLKTDPRFRNTPLPVNQQLHLFHDHVERIRSKHMDSLHILFQSYSPSLATPFDTLPLPSLLISMPVTKLGLDIRSLESEFESWQRQRTHESRKEFDEMLAENSFVEFWGRLGKIGGEGVDGGVKADDLEEDEGEGGGGRVDMKALAKNVDVQDMEKVLKNDRRYIMFDHVPEQRERWLRDYLSNLSAPKLSVHLNQASV